MDLVSNCGTSVLSGIFWDRIHQVITTKFISVQSAANLAEFSLSMLRDGVLPARSWLSRLENVRTNYLIIYLRFSSRFNYDAAIVGLLGRLWVRRLERLHLSVNVGSGQLKDDEMRKVVQEAMTVLRHCSTREPVVSANLRNVSQLQSVLDGM
jgi:hypothetical protein